MSIPKIPQPVKWITSIIYSNQDICEIARSHLVEKWGDIDLCESQLPFHYTDYYYQEMGYPLFRSLFSFKTLRDRCHLIEAKIYSNKIENSLAKETGFRSINVDPGYLTDSQVVLATGKDFSHRIYLGKGIFADLTLVFKHKKYRALPWTYPDYADEPLLNALMKIRCQYLKEIAGKRKGF